MSSVYMGTLLPKFHTWRLLFMTMTASLSFSYHRANSALDFADGDDSTNYVRDNAG